MFYFNLQNVTFNDIFIIFVWVETPTYNLRLLHPYANPLDSSQEPFGLVGSQAPDSPNNTNAGLHPALILTIKNSPGCLARSRITAFRTFFLQARCKRTTSSGIFDNQFGNFGTGKLRNLNDCYKILNYCYSKFIF